MNSIPASTSARISASRSAVGGCRTGKALQDGGAAARRAQPLDDRELQIPLEQRLVDLCGCALDQRIRWREVAHLRRVCRLSANQATRRLRGSVQLITTSWPA